MLSTNKKRIAVLRGGPSSEHSISLASGQNVINNLDRELFVPIDIYIDRAGTWHESGVEVNPYEALVFADTVFNSLHGEYGEDGTVQKVLNDVSIQYTGSDNFASKIAMDKHTTKILLEKEGIKMPKNYIIRNTDTNYEKKLADIWRKEHSKLIVKPNSSGSSVGLMLATNYIDLVKSVKNILEKGHSALIEEYIEGKEVSVSVIENMRGEALYVPIPSHIKHDGKVFDNVIKKSAKYRVVPMQNFSQAERDFVSAGAKIVHRVLGLRDYSTSDFIVTSDGIYFLEVNTLPGLTEHSILPQALLNSGISMKDFLTHLIGLTGKKVETFS